MADEEELEGQGQEESAEQPSGFGVPVSETPNVMRQARNAGRAVANAARGVANAVKNTGKFIADLVGPGSKVKLAILGVDVGLFALAVIIFVVGLIFWLLVGSGGSSPPPALALDQKQTQDNLTLIKCFTTPPQNSSDDPANDDAIVLSQECQKLVRQELEADRKFIASIRDQITHFKEGAERDKAKTLLDKMETEMEAIKTANGKFKLTKQHYEALQKLRHDPIFQTLDFAVNLDVPIVDQQTDEDCDWAHIAQTLEYFANQPGSAYPGQKYNPTANDQGRSIGIRRNSERGKATVLNEQLKKLFPAGGVTYAEFPGVPDNQPKYWPTLIGSLQKGGPVVIWTSFYGAHVFLLTGYNPTTKHFIANNAFLPLSDGGFHQKATTQLDRESNGLLTLDNVAAHTHYRGSTDPHDTGFLYYNGTRTFR